MAIKIRLARAGSKKRPFYKIVASDSRMPRDGRFIEKLGTYNPLLSKDDENRVNLKLDRIKAWLEKGAKATDRIQRILEKMEVLPEKKRNNPKKGLPGKAAKERQEKKSSLSEKENEASENQSKKEEKPEEELINEEKPKQELINEEKPEEKLKIDEKKPENKKDIDKNSELASEINKDNENSKNTKDESEKK